MLFNFKMRNQQSQFQFNEYKKQRRLLDLDEQDEKEKAFRKVDDFNYNPDQRRSQEIRRTSNKENIERSLYQVQHDAFRETTDKQRLTSKVYVWGSIKNIN